MFFNLRNPNWLGFNRPPMRQDRQAVAEVPVKADACGQITVIEFTVGATLRGRYASITDLTSLHFPI